MRFGIIAALVLLSCAAAHSTPLPPQAKAALLNETNNSCLETQVKETSNKAMTVGQLQTYCGCYAKAFSEIMSAEELEKNKNELTPEVQKKAGELSQKCAASTLKK